MTKGCEVMGTAVEVIVVPKTLAELPINLPISIAKAGLAGFGPYRIL